VFVSCDHCNLQYRGIVTFPASQTGKVHTLLEPRRTTIQRAAAVEQNSYWVGNNRFVERLCSLPRSQQSDAGPFPKPHESSSYSNIYPTRCNATQFILSGNCSTCFGWYLHPSAGAQTTVSTASGICHTVEQFPDKINCVTLHLVGYIYWNIITMRGPMNVKSHSYCYFLFL
jgi:hypothetical protein